MVSRAAHRTVKAVSEDIDRLAFNKAVAQALRTGQHGAAAAAAVAGGRGRARRLPAPFARRSEMLIVMIAPMMPHLAEECWAALGGSGFVANRMWPTFDRALTVDEDIIYPVQINGKKRGDLTIARDADQAAVEQAALALDVGAEGAGRPAAAQGDRRSAEDRECRRLSQRPALPARPSPSPS